MCPGCEQHHEEIAKNFIVLEGDNLWHRTCWEKEVREHGTEG